MGRKNNRHAFYCSACKCHVKYIKRHEKTKKHKYNIINHKESSIESTSSNSTQSQTSNNGIMHESSETISLYRTNNMAEQNDLNSVSSDHSDDDVILDNSESNHRHSISQSIISTSSSDNEFSLDDDDEDMYHTNMHNIYTMNLE